MVDAIKEDLGSVWASETEFLCILNQCFSEIGLLTQIDLGVRYNEVLEMGDQSVTIFLVLTIRWHEYDDLVETEELLQAVLGG